MARLERIRISGIQKKEDSHHDPQETLIRKNLMILNDTALRILSQTQKGSIFGIIGEQLGKLCPKCLFIINSYHEATGQLKSEYIHSDRNFLETFIRITSLSLKEISSTLEDDEYEQMLSGEFLQITGGLHDILSRRIPEPLCRLVEDKMGLQNFYMRGIVYDNTLFGNAIIITTQNCDDIDLDILNTLFIQASLGFERRKLDEELRSAKETAEEMNRLKSAFLANMSHELRTPLNGILGFSELLLESLNDPHQKDMVSVINRSGIRLLDTLNTILDFSTIESQNVSLTYSEENIAALLRNIIRNLTSDASKKNLSLTYKTSSEDIKGYTVKIILEKIVSHLLSNAIKFTNKGKVTLTLKEDFSNGRRTITIAVKDTGIGIPVEQQEFIFDEFRQNSEGFNRQYEGTGLGLTISRKFAAMLKGDLSLQSQPGKGSVFTLRIPLPQDPPSEQSK